MEEESFDEEAFEKFYNDSSEHEWVSWNKQMKDYISLCPFNKIDILNNAIPIFPFLQLSLIVERAKKILPNRSQQEIFAATEHLRWIINSYFHQFRNEAERRQKSAVEFMQFGVIPVIDEPNGMPKFKDINHLNSTKNILDYVTAYPQPLNTSELTALQNCMYDYDLANAGFPTACTHEYFAVLALWLAADCIDRLRTNLDMEQNSDPNNIDTAFISECDNLSTDQQAIALAGVQASEAMNAICYAEQLVAIRENSKMLSQHNTTALSLNAKKASRVRHAKNHELHALAVKLFFERSDWHSVSAASKAIFPKLQEHGGKIGHTLTSERGPKTVYDWLLKARKKKDAS